MQTKRKAVPHMCITCQHYEPYHCNLNDGYIGYVDCELITKCRAWRLSDNYKKGGKFYGKDREEDGDAETVQRCIEAMNNPKAADVELKRYAEWISPDGISVCSKCGKAAPYDVEGDVIMYWPNLNFCPNCGCRMNVEGKDAEVH